MCGGLGGGFIIPLTPCFLGGRGGGLIRILAIPRGGGSGTSSNSVDELDSLELASEEQDFNGEAGDSLVAEKSTGNVLSTDCALLPDMSTSNSFLRVDFMGLGSFTKPCMDSVESFSILVSRETPAEVGMVEDFGVEVSSGGRDTERG